MPVYASTEGFAGQGRHPRALMFIVGGHAVLVAAVMTAKMEVIALVGPTKTIVELIEEVKPPPPLPPEPVPPKPEHPVQPRDSQIDLQKPIVPILTQDPVELAASLPQLPSPGPIGSGTESIANPTPRLDPVAVQAGDGRRTAGAILDGHHAPVRAGDLDSYPRGANRHRPRALLPS
jgi:hypothetical protein